MKLSAPWHRKAASPRVRGSADATGSLAAIAQRLDGLSRKLEGLPANVRRHDTRADIEDALETAISGLRGVIAHVRSTEALSDLSDEVDALGKSPAAGSLRLRPRLSISTNALRRLRTGSRRCVPRIATVRLRTSTPSSGF